MLGQLGIPGVCQAELPDKTQGQSTQIRSGPEHLANTTPYYAGGESTHV